jgi:aryl-alcohol dehydrogenase-like predicted oxidoreductase
MLSKIILGTVQFGLKYGINNQEGQVSGEEVNKILDLAAKSGIRVLDTALSYGNALERIGEFHRLGGVVFEVNTKFRIDPLISISDQLARSLEILSVDTINTYFYHSFSDYIHNPDVMQELKALRKKGAFKKIGVSIYTNEEMLRCIDDEDIHVIQLPFNLLDNSSQRGECISLAKQKGKEIHARSIYLQGLFFMESAQVHAKLLPLFSYIDALREITSDLKIDFATLAMSYVKKKSGIDNIIIGVDSERHLVDNIKTMDFEMNEFTVQRIDRIVVNERALLNPQNWQ